MNESRMKIITEVEAGDNVISVKSPFKLYKDRNRRYIRLEISEPVAYRLLRDHSGGFWPMGNEYGYNGSILNISAGGVLLIGNEPIEEGSVILIKMTLQDVEVLDNIIGIVKRADVDGEEWLIGIEFISREHLPDYFSQAEHELLPDNVTSFNEQLRDVLNKYVYYRRVSERNE